MGKTTLYHPVSLTVIRAAALYCGWQIGKLEQIYSDVKTVSAGYKCEIVQMPRGAEDWPLKSLLRQFQHCFTDDIVVTTILANSEGWVQARLAVHVEPEPENPSGTLFPELARE